MRKPELAKDRARHWQEDLSIWLDKAQDVICKFSTLGRIFGFGDIEIESAGTCGKNRFWLSTLPSEVTGGD
jgi:hypothetical protein